MNIREIRNHKQKIWIYALVLIPFLYFVCVMIYPLLVSVYYSLTKWKGIGDPKFIGFDNYGTMLKSSDFWLVTKNTLFLSVVCTIGQVGIALIIAFLMTFRRLKLKAFHRAVIFFPVVMAPIVVGYVWRLQFQLWPAECVSESNRASGVDPLLAGRSEYRTPDGIHTGYMAVHRALHDYPYERDFRNPTGSL